MRIVIVGISGCGKTTLATQLAARFDIPRIELDALNWDPGWRNMSIEAPETFIRRVALAVAAPDWVLDGNYSLVRPLVWPRATHLIWLDYDRPVVMARVIRRSLRRAWTRDELWNGNRERWTNMWHPSHPISWAWRHWRGRRAQIEGALESGEYDHLQVIRLRRPAEASGVVAWLIGPQGAPPETPPETPPEIRG
jgi:adenylate kinase family enzyme